jgi:probable rRNA maturation factor
VLEVFVADEQSVHAIDVQRWGDLARNVLLAEGIRGDAELSDLNARFMDGEGPTDVLSFPIEEDLMELGRWPDLATTGPDRSPPDPSDAPLLLGDVVISPEVAAANAPGHAGSFDDEIALLVVHGVLHILGLDHGDPDEAREMRAKEQDLLARFHGPVAAGTEVPPEQ